MDDYLQKLLKELGEAINRVLENSDDIAEARERIRKTLPEYLHQEFPEARSRVR